MIKISVDKKTLSIEQMTAINRFEEALEMIILKSATYWVSWDLRIYK